jgi:hypothetical protein
MKASCEEQIMSELVQEALRILRTFVDRLTHGGLDPNQPFTYRFYDQPLTSIDVDEVSPVLAFEKKAKENPDGVFLAFRKKAKENPDGVCYVEFGPGSAPISNGLGEVYTKPDLSGLSANRAVAELFNWHSNHVELLNLTREVDDHSLFDLYLTTLFRRSEELYRSHFVNLPPLEIGTAYIDYLNAKARASSNGVNVTVNHGIATLPFWLAALRRLPRPWDDIDPSQCKELAGFAGVTEYVLRGTRAPGLNEFIAELSETNELRWWATGYGGWYSNPDGSGLLVPQDELDGGGTEKSSHVRITMETFMLCHELAHVALGHLDRFVAGQRNRWSKRQRLHRHAEQHQKEIEADALAIEMTCYLRPFSVRPGLTDRIFAPIPLVEALVSFYLLLACGEPRYESIREINERTHPVAITRLEGAVYHFAKWFWREQEPQGEELIGAIGAWRRDLLILPQLVRAVKIN